MPNDSANSKAGLLPPSYFFISLIAGVILRLLLPIHQLLPWPLALLGCVPLAFGAWITVWADQIFKQRGTTVKPHLTPSALITNGPFRISRHPMYLGMTLILAGIAMLLGSVTAFIAPLAFALVMQLNFIPLEEESMEHVFGDDYRTYKRRVRCWI